MTGEKVPLKTVVSVDAMMKTIASVFLTISLAIASWSLLEVVDLKERMAKVETKTEGQHEMLKEIRADLKEIRRIVSSK